MTFVDNYLQVVVPNQSSELRYEGDWISSTHDKALSGAVVTLPEGGKGSILYEIRGTTNILVHGILQDFTLATDENPNFKLSYEISPHDPTVLYSTFGGRFNSTSGWSLELHYLASINGLHPEKIYTLNITLEALGPPMVWFDALLFNPKPARNIDNALMLLDDDHLMIHYDSDWTIHIGGVHATSASGSKMSLDFDGISIKVYTLWNTHSRLSNATENSSASWIVDDSEPQTFVVPAPGPADVGDRLKYCQRLLFEVSGLSPGTHRLDIMHHGTDATWPLMLSKIIVQNAPVNQTSAGGNSRANITRNDNLKGITIIAIAVSISCMVLVVCAVCFIWYRKRRIATQKTKQAKTSEDVDRQSTLHRPYDSSASEPEVKGRPALSLISTSLNRYPHEPMSPLVISKDGPPVIVQGSPSPDTPPPYSSTSPLSTASLDASMGRVV
ncbi:hypothetical protein CVT24_009156 [Panaeolus cyanescens]|uniref:Uncharacterized protein n=1 Tax=Panaeolus cyanescens TaxID=181874 RepID=A0A409Y8C4_9AGAR|nr:hypothetical protein CVT24_009156 [Panaeolus cyanescens]